MKYIYVLGYGRSGSTLIENRVVDLTSALALGEVKYLVERGLLYRELCSCGKKVDECEYWSLIYKNLLLDDDVNFRELDSLNKISTSASEMESTFRFPKNLFFNTVGKRLYFKSLLSIVNSIQLLSETKIVIDSSKLPARLYWLIKEIKIKPSVLFVIRDPRAVAWSWARVIKRDESNSGSEGSLRAMPRFSYFSAISRWALNSALSFFILKLTKAKYLVIRYEDFVVNNEIKMLEIEDFLRRSFDYVDFKKNSGTVHSISGNPRRLSGGMDLIKLDEEWKEGIPRWKQVLTYWLLFPLMLIFKYKM